MTAARERFDWRRIQVELNARLASARVSYEQDTARTAAILRERTAQLAAIPARRVRGSASADFLIFRAAGARYALALPALREVVPMPPIADVPGAAETVRGVAPWRGEFVTVFDLAPALGLDAQSGDAAYAVILRKAAPRMALAIESAEGMAHLNVSDIRAADGWQAGRTELLRGATADAVTILDEHRLAARLSEELRDA